jgi:Domain of unknown function (DUF1707)
MGLDQMGPAGMGPMVSPSWLAATADRERTVGALRAGFVEGRLTQDELDERIAQAYAARTYGDLWALTADLPTGVLPYPPSLPYPQGAVAPGFGPQASAARPANAEADNSWRSGAALLILAMVIFTLAALVTAIITAHAQPGLVSPVVNTPFQVTLIPNVVHHLPVSGGQG